jgi:hypothetical protein
MLGPKSAEARAMVSYTDHSQSFFVVCEYFELFEIARFPIALVCFPNHVGRLERPTQASFVREAHPDIRYAFLENIFDPIQNLSPNAGILFGGHALSWIRLHGHFALGH